MIRLAVFGNPVRHSLSPRIHTAFAAQFNLDIEYRAIEATAESFPAELDRLEAAGGLGCNVTVPFKHAAWELCGNCSERARLARAANTVMFSTGGERYADNTDGSGLVRDLESRNGLTLDGARICLLGAGGAAAGVLAALLERNPGSLTIANRSMQRAEELAARHADLGTLATCRPDDLEQAEAFDLVINATSLGHQGKAPAIEAAWLTAGGIVYDMNYGAAAVPLGQHCRGLGLPYSDGLGMLVGQAAVSFELWTGRAPEQGSVLQELRQAG